MSQPDRAGCVDDHTTYAPMNVTEAAAPEPRALKHGRDCDPACRCDANRASGRGTAGFGQTLGAVLRGYALACKIDGHAGCAQWFDRLADRADAQDRETADMISRVRRIDGLEHEGGHPWKCLPAPAVHDALDGAR